MKTLRNLKATSLLSLFAAFLLSLTGCQKDEMPIANIGTTASIDQESPSNGLYRMVLIDHASAGTESPDFSVELRSDGKVIFQGRNNTATLGTRTFAVSDNKMTEVRDAINSFNMAGMPTDDIKVELAATTVRFKETAKANPLIRSANDEFQTDLIQMAAKIEIILGADQYIINDIKQ